MNHDKSLTLSEKLLSEAKKETSQLDLIKEYLKEGADINHQSRADGYTPLMYAVLANNELCVAYLLRQGANPLLRSHHQKTARNLTTPGTAIEQLLKNSELLYATHLNDIETVKSLLSEGADINFQGMGGYSPLLIAVEQNNLGLVELCLTKGANLALEREDGQGVFELVTNHLIYITLENKEPLSEEDKEFLRLEAETDWNGMYREARLKTLAARQGRPFQLSDLKFYRYEAPASQAQLLELEKHFGHPLPHHLKEMFTHYNGGDLRLRTFGEYDEDHSISHFYLLDEKHKKPYKNVWVIIENFSDYLGLDTLPFAEDSDGSIYFIKWEDGQAKVYLLSHGEIALEYFDGYGEPEDWDEEEDYPTQLRPITNSFDEFLEGLYETD